MNDIFTFKLPINLFSTLAGAFAGGVVGFVLVYLVNFIWRPKVKFLGFCREEANFGILYKVRFKLKGRANPGLCCLYIEWCGKNVFAKWDETPNPLEDDNLSKFRPELVPATFYQPLFLSRDYEVPIIIDNKGEYEVFSGWWFGRDKGYCPNRKIEKTGEFRLTLQGSGFRCSKKYVVSEVLMNC